MTYPSDSQLSGRSPSRRNLMTGDLVAASVLAPLPRAALTLSPL
jgi:hypothetical protein